MNLFIYLSIQVVPHLLPRSPQGGLKNNKTTNHNQTITITYKMVTLYSNCGYYSNMKIGLMTCIYNYSFFDLFFTPIDHLIGFMSTTKPQPAFPLYFEYSFMLLVLVRVAMASKGCSTTSRNSGVCADSLHDKEVLDLLEFWGDEKVQQILKNSWRNIDFFLNDCSARWLQRATHSLWHRMLHEGQSNETSI